MKTNKLICIFCSSSDILDKIYFENAKIMAKYLANNNYSLIYGGGKIGLMGEVARTFKSEKAKTIGVIPEKLSIVANKEDDETIITETMSERKNVMVEKADAFISLPGGFGTLEEILEVITLKQLGYIDKPIVFFNTNNFYGKLFEQFEVIFNEKFAKETSKNLYFISDSPEQIINYLNNYEKSEFVPKWF
jgi:cytokinin riboside 5'-monophosphate phosphoribohydrolase